MQLRTGDAAAAVLSHLCIDAHRQSHCTASRYPLAGRQSTSDQSSSSAAQTAAAQHSRQTPADEQHVVEQASGSSNTQKENMVRIKKRGARAAGGPKQKQQKRLFKKVQVNEPEIAKHWDPRRSRGANLARMGLSDDANRAVGVPGAAPSRVEVAQEVKLRLVDAPQPARLMDVDKNTNKRRNPMSEEKQKYISTLMKKHGRDFAKMARDRKRNPQQFTATKLRKMVELYESLSDDQRVVVA